MAFATLPKTSRRAFTLSLAGAGVTLLRSQTPEMHWALLSDTHIPTNASEAYRGFKPVDNLGKIVPEILAAKPEGALICGDIARLEGLKGDYQAVQSLLQPVSSKMPVAMALGNHDHRDNFLGVLGQAQSGAQPLKGRHLLVIESPVARFVVLDSNVQANSTPGFLGKAQRAWLAAYLQANANLPTLVFVHHTLDDGDGSLLDAPRLFDLLRPHRHVKAIVYGHSHRYAYDMWEGVHLINLPAIGYNFNDGEPVGWVDARITPAGGAFTLRAFGGNMEKNGKTTVLAWRS